MNLDNYIRGERFGKQAHELEKEAMHDPFLQDAIDGYDLDDDRPAYHLKKLQKQIKKKTRKRNHYLRLFGIAACVLIIICLTIFFFIYDSDNKIHFSVETPRVVVLSNDSAILDRMLDSLAALKTAQTLPIRDTILNNTDDIKKENEATNQLVDLLAANERLPVQQESRSRVVETLNQRNNEPYSYTLSNSETQDLLANSARERSSIIAPIQQTPKPSVGDKEYSDYVNRNRNPVTDNNSEKQHGKVILVFKVNENGRPVNITVLRSLNPVADREATRLLQNGPDWTVSEISARLEIDF